MTDRTKPRARTISMTLSALPIAVAATCLAAPLTVKADGDDMPGAPRAARSITGGFGHTCALLDDGRVVCWGDGAYGQLGNGSTEDVGDELGEMGADLVPVDLGPGRTARAIAAGAQHTCALLDTAQVACWGEFIDGQLGTGASEPIGDDPGEMGAALATVDLGTGRSARAITAGYAHTCALLDNRQVKCWGAGGYGRLGLGSQDTLGDGSGEMGDALPTVSLGTGRTARSISAGDLHTCALLDNRQVKCWGNNSWGQLGQETTVALGDDANEMGDDLPPVDLGTGRTARSVSAGETHTCALLDNGRVKCWGSGLNGRRGSGSPDSVGVEEGEMGDDLAAVNLGTGRTATGLVAGTAHTCALLDNGRVKCWGAGEHGATARGSTADVGDAPGEMGDALSPVNLGTGRTALSVTGSGSAACAVLDDLSVKCWGWNGDGQLGLGDTADRGDGANEMGNSLPRVDVGGTVGQGTLRPDGLIRKAGDPFVGGGIYNRTGDRQTRSARVRAGGTQVFVVRIENDGNEPDVFVVKGTKASKRFDVSYRRGATTITGRVTAGTSLTPTLQPGEHTDITVTIRAKSPATAGDAITAKVTVTSRTDTTEKDVVRATVTRR